MKEIVHEIKTGWQATSMLTILRWRMLRSTRMRVITIIGALMLLLSVITTINMGYAAQVAAQTADTRQGDFARIWATILSTGEVMNIGAIAIGGALLTAIFAPLLGASTIPLAPTEDLYGIRPARLHRYFDSLLINSISGLGVLQLLVLTSVASLLTMDGVRAPGIFYSWSLWVLFIFFMTTLGWSLEWVFRRFGRQMKKYLLVSFILILGIALLIDPNHGSTLFGASRLYTDTVRQSINGWTTLTTIAIVLTLTAAIIMLMLGIQATRKALLLPPQAKPMKDFRKYRELGKNSYKILLSMVFRILTRTSEVRKPLTGLILSGFVVMLFLPLDSVAQFSIIAAIPLTLSLAWGTNVYGLIGTGMVWLESMPKVLKKLPLVLFFLQFIASIILFATLLGISFLTRNATPEQGLNLMLGGIVASFSSAAISLYLATSNPHRARLSGSGDSIIPPVTAIYYMLILLFAGPVPVSLVLALTDLTLQGIIILAVIGLALFFLLRTFLIWRNRNKRAQLIAMTSAA